MHHGFTPSEQFVTALCEQSFLKLWTHPNPKGKKNKELCDCLIVCGPHIVIISVKECNYKDTGDKTGLDRWIKSAVKKSAAQIWGAERWLETTVEFERNDGRMVRLPAKEERIVHRVSVSLGGAGKVPIKWGDLGNGFVHVCNEKSIDVLLSALDTITDLVEFLTKSEKLINDGVCLMFDGGGLEDLVALYLSWGNSFEAPVDLPQQPDMLILDDSLWEYYSNSPKFDAKRKELEDSYNWDQLIENFTTDLLTNCMFDMHSKKVTDNELALVAMALQPRGHRANLAEAFMAFLKNPELKIASRAVLGHANTAFVFLIGKSSKRDYRAQELILRCLVIRGRAPDVTTVVGIATDRPGTSEIGYSEDIVYLHMPEWTAENEHQVCDIQAELKYFRNTKWSKH